MLPKITQQIEHDGGGKGGDVAQGKSANGADLLFKLAGGAGLGGEVTGVVNPRGELIDPEGSVGELKHLHREKADQADFFCDLPRELSGVMGGGFGNLGGKKSPLQNSILMAVFKRGIGNGTACGIPGGDDGELAQKGDVFL